jgi:3-phosphoshikimate 1-carboxyvinyltransferase
MPDLYAVPRRHEPLDAVVAVPGSKSIANRALVCAALAEGSSMVRGLPDGDDTLAMIDGLRALGVPVVADGTFADIGGLVGGRLAGGATVDARLAGTTSRFLTAVAALGERNSIVDGGAPLRQRPMAPLHDALAALGADVHRLEATQLPVRIGRGRLTGGTLALPGDVSSQFVSALMLIAPLLDGGLSLRFTTPLVSRPYVAITAAVMSAFGVHEVHLADEFVKIGEGRYRGREFLVEPDASSASYPLAAAAVCGGRVTVPGLTSSSVQGDARFGELLERMGCSLTQDAAGTTVSGGPPLRGIDLDMSDLSDLVPTLAVVAACASSPTVIRGVGFIRGKESDRLGDLAAELTRAGIDIAETDDGLVVRPSVLRAAQLGTHHDHRLAMSFGVLGLTVDGIVVEDPGVVSKSWPGYWASLERW